MQLAEVRHAGVRRQRGLAVDQLLERPLGLAVAAELDERVDQDRVRGDRIRRERACALGELAARRRSRAGRRRAWPLRPARPDPRGRGPARGSARRRRARRSWGRRSREPSAGTRRQAAPRAARRRARRPGGGRSRRRCSRPGGRRRRRWWAPPRRGACSSSRSSVRTASVQANASSVASARRSGRWRVRRWVIGEAPRGARRVGGPRNGDGIRGSEAAARGRAAARSS